ncbi:conserved oligomeric Golgi complex subunit 1-like isoform X2 [Xenia sp. Carnegie-2017]|uniref:conserved oligomeric Golgi complex subunit 1-like isoform X2 n=1 Tax=Xenia sp. Carnegie-2017 TaxID=2897299 RepID=UPI001F03B446|nr:conserved oligomeric Golgi complex subunit 1-like isoform X2 [Xenia sp. Carnegie-2017]
MAADFQLPTSPRHSRSLSTNDLWDAEENTQNLFQKHSVVEIVEVEKQTRGDIERKKEDLRLMVGERYRDLIDAADTIGEMKQCSGNVNSSIKNIQENCKELYHTHQSRGISGYVATSIDKSKATFYSVASQMKLLVDIPEKIWNSLEHHEYLKAAQLYLLAQNIVSSLHIETGGGTTSKLLTSFPILPQQWSSISHFKDSILQGSRELLRDYTQSEQTVSNCLCAIMFLEDSTPRQVFNEFLVARQGSLQELFDPRHQANGIKTQLCEVVRLIMSSLYQVFVLFCSDENEVAAKDDSGDDSLLFVTMDKITSQSQNSATEGDRLRNLFGQEFDLTLLRHLPASVIKFRPRLRSASNFISMEYIQSNCKTWLEKCMNDVRKNVNVFLQYIGTLKALASIRDSIWELLNPTIKSNSFHNVVLTNWSAATGKCLGNVFSLWERLFKDEFVERSKAILNGQLEALMGSCKSATKKALDDLHVNQKSQSDRSVLWERDVSLYVWHENSSDLSSKNVKQLDNEASTFNESGLTFKTKACTPVIQGLCRTFNDRLSYMLDDASCFIKISKENIDSSTSAFRTGHKNNSPVQSVDDDGPFDRYGDSELLQNFLRSKCAEVIKELLGYFDSLLRVYDAELKSHTWEDLKIGMETPKLILAIDSALFLARLTRSFIDYCPNLAELMGEKKDQKTRKARYNRTPLRKKVSELSNTKFDEVKEHFRNTHRTGFGIWCRWVSSMFRASFDVYLQQAKGPNTMLTTANWAEIVINEETESGEQVHSSIHVPSQVSSYVTVLLFSVCEEINRVGGHAMDRSVLRDLVRVLGEDLLLSYETLLDCYRENKEIIDQNRALQCIFDFKFTSSILGDRSKTENDGSYKARFEKIIEQLEDIVDPFDLNVFSPYLNSNLNKHLQRCGVLFGVLVNVDRHSHFYGMPQKPAQTSQDQHNVMPVANSSVRFSLLPLSSHHADRNESRNVKATESEDVSDDYNFLDTSPFYKHQNFLMSEMLMPSSTTLKC